MTTAIGIAMIVWGGFHLSGMTDTKIDMEKTSLVIFHNLALAVTTASFIFGVAIVIGANFWGS